MLRVANLLLSSCQLVIPSFAASYWNLPSFLSQAHSWGRPAAPAFRSRLHHSSSSDGLPGGSDLGAAAMRRATSLDMHFPLPEAWLPQLPARADALNTPSTSGAASAAGSPPSGNSLLAGLTAPALLEQADNGACTKYFCTLSLGLRSSPGVSGLSGDLTRLQGHVHTCCI